MARLQDRAVRRLQWNGLAYSWSSWLDFHGERKREAQLLRSSAERLRRPLLVACFSGWKYDWEAAAQAELLKVLRRSLAAEKEERKALQRQLERAHESVEAASSAAEARAEAEA
eukprot:7381257-Prymnesium_polylepis.1